MSEVNLKLSKTARAPGKIIISGEHSVVYGRPALAMAIANHTDASVFWRQDDNNVLFNLMDFCFSQLADLQQLRLLKAQLQDRYIKYLIGRITIGEVLQEKSDLLKYSLIQLIDNVNLKFANGLQLQVNTTLPIGYGLGSSAAVIVSTLFALKEFFQLKIDEKYFYQLAIDAENLQHGRSSGIDVFLALKGGCYLFCEDKAEKRSLPKMQMFLVNTGSPQTTTGQCVAAVARHFRTSKNLADDFADVTLGLDQALHNDNFKLTCELIKANHELLNYIGVVPEKVQNLIKDLEKRNAVGKICGAGASCGDNAGMVLVLCQEKVDDLIEEYGYHMFPVVANEKGVCIV